jgi:1,4-alpha-glucan branching enzyme
MRSTDKRKTSTHPVTVHFELTNPLAHKVYVAGTFNDWQPDQIELIPSGNGRWERDLMLEPGFYEYRLVVDGQWMPDPKADHTVLNQFGERNSVLTVP